MDRVIEILVQVGKGIAAIGGLAEAERERLAIMDRLDVIQDREDTIEYRLQAIYAILDGLAEEISYIRNSGRG